MDGVMKKEKKKNWSFVSVCEPQGLLTRKP